MTVTLMMIIITVLITTIIKIFYITRTANIVF